MEREELQERLTERLEGKKEVLCAQALAWAREYKVDAKQITEILNEKGIKIVNCQLGCF